MAGVSAGRLSIELVAEVARLQQDLDRAKRMVNAASGEIARSAKAANDNLAGMGTIASAATADLIRLGAASKDVATRIDALTGVTGSTFQRSAADIAAYGAEMDRLRAKYNPMFAVVQRYKQSLDEIRRAQAVGAISEKEMAAAISASRQQALNSISALKSHRAALDSVTGSSRAMQAGFQNAGFQVSDFFVQIGSGTSAVRAAALQLPQLTQAISMMGMGAEGATGKFGAFAKFMSGGWGIAITVGISLLGALATSLLESSDASDKAGDAITDLSQQFDFAALSSEELRKVNELLAKKNAEVERTAIGAANAARIEAEANRENALSKLLVAEAELARRNAIFDASAAAGSIPAMGPGGLDLANQLAQIKALRASIMGFGQEANKASFNVQILTAGLDENGRAAEKLRTQINDLRVEYQRTGNSAILDEALRLQGQLNDLEDRSSAAHRRKADALSDEEKAYKKAFDSTQQFIDSLTLEIAKIGLSDKAVRQMEIQRAKDAAATEEQRKKIDELNVSRENALKIEEELARIKDAKAGTAALQEEIAALQLQAKALGLVGWERERLLTILETEAEISPLRVLQADAERKSETALAQEYQKQIDLLKERMGLRLNEGDFAEGIRLQEEAAKDAEQAARRLNDQYRDMIRLLDKIGGLGSVLGSVLAIASGNYNDVAQGPLGDLLAFVLNMPTGDTIEKNGRKTAEVLGDELANIFGAGGIFGKTLAEALQAAGVGLAAANAVGVGKSGASQFLASAGGLFGEIAGEKLLGKLLGDFAGPVGSILGGILGGVIGGLISGPAKGSVTISNGQIVAGRGSDQQMLANANSAASSVIDALNQIADALGGTLNMGAGSVSIGQRKGNWVVDIFGRGNTTGAGVISFGQDSEAAIMFAMENLIEDGVLGGIRASTMNILRAGSDLETQLNKALAFEAVLKAAEEASSPFAAQLKAMGTQFTQLTAIFAEANATAEEYAALQAYITQQQQALIDQASATYRSIFNTDAQNVAYAQQQISATLTPLGYGSVDTVEEYKALVEATDALANPELYGALMDLADEFGVLKDAADAAAQAAAVEAAQKEAAAAEAAAKAKQIADQQAQLQVDLLRAQGREVEAVAKARQLELAALDPSLRALQQQVWQAQDIAAAKDVLSAAWVRESAAFEQTIDKFRGLKENLQDVRAGIFDAVTAGGDYARQLALLKQTGMKASLGDQTAMADLGGVIRDFLPAAKSQARTLAEYQMAQALAARYADSAISAVDQGMLVAQQQLDQMRSTVGKLIDIENATISVEQAIEDLTALMGSSGNGGTSGGVPSTPVGRGDDLFDEDGLLDRLMDRLGGHLGRRLDRLEAAQVAGTVAQNRLARIFKNADRGSEIAVRIVADETVA